MPVQLGIHRLRERSRESHLLPPTVTAAPLAVFARIMPRRKRPYSTHSASSPRPPAMASHGHKSVDDSGISRNRGTPICAPAGGVHFDSHISGSVNEYRNSRTPTTTLTPPGAPEKKFNVRSRMVNGTAEPSSAVTFTSAAAVSWSITSLTAPTLPPETS